MIVVICNMFEKEVNGIPSGQCELLADFAVDLETGGSVIVPAEHPTLLGAKFDFEIGEWVIE
jgi:hypothetical protein